MISKNLEKINIGSLNPRVFVDELPLNEFKYKVDPNHHWVDRKSFRIMNREHKLDSYPEE